MNQLDKKRITLYLLISFGFTWVMSFIIYLTGGIADSPEIIPGTGIRLFLVLLVVAMFGPLLGNVGTRLITKEGWQETGLRLNIRQGWPYWLLAWLAPPILVTLGGAVYFALFPPHFYPDLTLF